jgi:hypothetical protein
MPGLKFLNKKLEKESKAGKMDNAIVTGCDYVNLLRLSLVTKPVSEVLPFKIHTNEDVGRIYDTVQIRRSCPTHAATS